MDGFKIGQVWKTTEPTGMVIEKVIGLDPLTTKVLKTTGNFGSLSPTQVYDKSNNFYIEGATIVLISFQSYYEKVKKNVKVN